MIPLKIIVLRVQQNNQSTYKTLFREEAKALIEFRNLTKRYGSVTAVNHLSFTLEEGRIYGFLGPNGAGKTTTLNMMTGYLVPDEGQVLIQGMDMLTEPEKTRRNIGYLPEVPPLYPDMTVREYLDFAAELKKLPKQQRKESVREVMAQTGIEDMKDRLIRNLSKGYRQRTGLAQALLGTPPILILDEPMVGLDPRQIVEIRELIRGLGNQHTIVLSSHILSEIHALCDHIMILSHGNLVASGDPESLMASMQKAEGLELTVRGTKEALGDLLKREFSLSEAAWEEAEEPGETSVILHSERDIREELFYALAKEHLPILQMKPVKASLEEVFLELTDHDLKNTQEILRAGEEKEFPAKERMAGAVPDEKAVNLLRKQDDVEQGGGTKGAGDL